MFETQIAKGMALLDQKRPGWETEINLNRLDISHCYHCVLGQIYGEFAYGINTLEIEEDAARFYGFAYPNSMQWDQLTNEWRAAIAQRLERQEGEDS